MSRKDPYNDRDEQQATLFSGEFGFDSFEEDEGAFFGNVDDYGPTSRTPEPAAETDRIVDMGIGVDERRLADTGLSPEDAQLSRFEDEPGIAGRGAATTRGPTTRDEEPHDDLLADHLAASVAQEERGYEPVRGTDLIDERIADAERAGVLDAPAGKDRAQAPRSLFGSSDTRDASIGRAKANGRFVRQPAAPAPNSPGKRSRATGQYVGDEVVEADPDAEIVRDRATGRFVVVRNR